MQVCLYLIELLLWLLGMRPCVDAAVVAKWAAHPQVPKSITSAALKRAVLLLLYRYQRWIVVFVALLAPLCALCSA